MSSAEVGQSFVDRGEFQHLLYAALARAFFVNEYMGQALRLPDASFFRGG